MYQGSCLCGKVKYELRIEPVKVSHCHCKMCQKQHGSAFATYASLPQEYLIYTDGKDNLESYNSSGSIRRRFCKTCGSNIEWSGSPDHPGWVAIAIATLDTPYKPESIVDIYTESKACWLQNS